jgi:phosphatidate cytidylyltransferase
MKKRIITAIFMALIFVPVLVLPELFPLFQILMGVLSLTATIEIINMYEKKKKFPGIVKYLIMICSVLIYLSATTEWQVLAETWELTGATPDIANDQRWISYELLKIFNININFLPMLLLCSILLFSMLVVYKDFNGDDIGKCLVAILYPPLGFAGMTILRSIGFRFILYMFMITVLTDVFAYFTGMLFGKHKMCPLISPKKTWEGAIGGTIIATLCATLFAFFYGKMFGSSFGPSEATTLLHDAPFLTSEFVDKLNNVEIFAILFVLSLVTSIVSQIGDLVASKLKRTYELKDYGDIFPGHGGILDRFDSAIFACMLLITVFCVMFNLSIRGM